MKHHSEDVVLDEEGVGGWAQDERLVEGLRMVVVRLKKISNNFCNDYNWGMGRAVVSREKSYCQ